MQLLKSLRFAKRDKKLFYLFILIICLILNISAFIGAYTLTHFKTPVQFGLGLTRPISSNLPSNIGLKYVTNRIPINQTEWLEAWSIPVVNSSSKGTIVLFPGNRGSKAKQLLPPAKVFHALGYDTLLVDFRGVGGSSGNTSTLGMREAEDVALSVNYAQKSIVKRPVILYGISMGSTAILKAVADGKVTPDAIILELPFARLVDAVGSRVRARSIPTFPMAELTVLWGSIQHGFNGFVHNPVDYASQVKCPTLILHGKLDKWTTESEIDRIYQNLRGTKQLSIFPNAGHDLLVTIDRDRWTQAIKMFLNSVK
jgi:alpha-beta hydrolase superfamily lysophospholipase